MLWPLVMALAGDDQLGGGFPAVTGPLQPGGRAVCGGDRPRQPKRPVNPPLSSACAAMSTRTIASHALVACPPERQIMSDIRI